MSRAHRAFFNGLAPEWDDMNPQRPELYDLVKKFGVSKGERILDLGAGTGRLSRILVELVGKEGRVVAGDLAEEMLHRAAKNISTNSLLFSCADACSLCFGDSAFDKVVCYSTFPHFTRPAKVLCEVRRVLKKGGRFLILHQNCSRKLNSFHSSLSKVIKYDVLPAAQQMIPMLQNAGLLPVQIIEHPGLYWVEAGKE